MAEAEIVICVNPKPGSAYQDGDIVNVYWSGKIADVFAQRPPDWPSDDSNYMPMSDTMLSHFLIIHTQDIPEAIALQLREGDETYKRKYKINWRTALGLTPEEIAAIEDRDTVVDIRDRVFDRLAVVAVKT